jgi:hypothetical protein
MWMSVAVRSFAALVLSISVIQPARADAVKCPCYDEAAVQGLCARVPQGARSFHLVTTVRDSFYTVYCDGNLFTLRTVAGATKPGSCYVSCRHCMVRYRGNAPGLGRERTAACLTALETVAAELGQRFEVPDGMN